MLTFYYACIQLFFYFFFTFQDNVSRNVPFVKMEKKYSFFFYHKKINVEFRFVQRLPYQFRQFLFFFFLLFNAPFGLFRCFSFGYVITLSSALWILKVDTNHKLVTRKMIPCDPKALPFFDFDEAMMERDSTLWIS